MSSEESESSTLKKPDISTIATCMINLMQMMATIRLIEENFDCSLGRAVEYITKHGDFDES